MSDVVPQYTRLAPSTQAAIDKVRALTTEVQKLEQVPFVTEHLLHGGMYVRTITLPADVVATAVLIKPATALIVAGDVTVWSNDDRIHMVGYNVLPGSAGRKIAFVTHSVMAMTMVFPCTTTTVEEAQKQFTDEFELLVPLSEVDRHRILITGE